MRMTKFYVACQNKLGYSFHLDLKPIMHSANFFREAIKGKQVQGIGIEYLVLQIK